LPEDPVRAHVAGAGSGRRQGLVVLEHAIVEGVGDEKISRDIHRQSRGAACAGCARRRRRSRTRACVGSEADSSCALAEDAIRNGIAGAAYDVRHCEWLIEFEHARVVYIGDVEISQYIDRESARAA